MEEPLRTALEALFYDSAWLEYGFLEPAYLLKQYAIYQSGEDPNREHYRYSAFRHLLASRTAFSESDIRRYIDLTQRDDDRPMARAALCDLIEWPGLTTEQLDHLSQHPLFSAP